ncbi:MAG: alkylphosphonate utilization protein [Deltaproteobacteria bacterium]|nr:alkylphosphonate utilization protein [Deltaproteobacteria bacterium]MBI3294038.1 alkylphosphonate utilization protein [Deltaproteobacteria bacterium]
METRCPKCGSQNIYDDSSLWNCLECSHEWSPGAEKTQGDDRDTLERKVKDAFGNVLSDGDAITVIKDLKVKGSSAVVKVGTKVKSIRIIDGVDGHDIACKIDGIGAMNLKSEFVKKA